MGRTLKGNGRIGSTSQGKVILTVLNVIQKLISQGHNSNLILSCHPLKWHPIHRHRSKLIMEWSRVHITLPLIASFCPYLPLFNKALLFSQTQNQPPKVVKLAFNLDSHPLIYLNSVKSWRESFSSCRSPRKSAAAISLPFCLICQLNNFIMTWHDEFLWANALLQMKCFFLTTWQTSTPWYILQSCTTQNT